MKSLKPTYKIQLLDHKHGGICAVFKDSAMTLMPGVPHSTSCTAIDTVFRIAAA